MRTINTVFSRSRPRVGERFSKQRYWDASERLCLPGNSLCPSPGCVLRRGGTLHLTEQTESRPGAARMRVERLKKAFRTGKQELVLFENLSFEVQAGEMLAIVGESGSGKSTLLHILGALDRPTAGEVYFGNLQLGKLTEE